MIFLRAIKDWVYDPNRFYYFTGANSANTLEVEEELEKSGFVVAKYDIYNYNYTFNPRLTIGLGKCSVLKRLRIRFVLWMSGVKGRVWYAE